MLPDGLTTVSQDPDHRDAFPSSAEVSDHRDGFPRAGSYGSIQTPYFHGIFYADENSERLRESDSGVQIVPAKWQPIRAKRSSNGFVAIGCESIEGRAYSFYSWYFCSCYRCTRTALYFRPCALAQIRDCQVVGKRVLGNQKLTMGLFLLFRGLMGTLHKRI